jgi:zinc transport system ATP-binding protein
MSGKVVEMRDVWLKYDGISVLEGVNLDVEEGDFLGIVGPNGAGKTTMLKIIVGLIRPDAGDVRVFGREPWRLGELRSLVGYVPQRHEAERFFPITVYEVVALGRIHRRWWTRKLRRKDREMIEKALEGMGMLEHSEKLFGELSGGQQQRVLLARALAQEPKLLVLDEPTSGVDQPSQENFYSLLSKLHDMGMTIIMVSHDIGAITDRVTKIACLSRKLYMHGCPLDVMKSEKLNRLYGMDVLLLTHEGREEE